MLIIIVKILLIKKTLALDYLDTSIIAIIVDIIIEIILEIILEIVLLD